MHRACGAHGPHWERRRPACISRRRQDACAPIKTRDPAPVWSTPEIFRIRYQSGRLRSRLERRILRHSNQLGCSAKPTPSSSTLVRQWQLRLDTQTFPACALKPVALEQNIPPPKPCGSRFGEMTPSRGDGAHLPKKPPHFRGATPNLCKLLLTIAMLPAVPTSRRTLPHSTCRCNGFFKPGL
jgi:hypothetical protein